MSAAKRVRCECGCGQAPATTCRQRLVECSCGLKVRMTREWLERVTLQCSCGGMLEPVCLLDRAQAGDDAAWAEIEGRRAFSGVQSERGRKGAQIAKVSRAIRDVQARRAAALAGAGHDLPF